MIDFDRAQKAFARVVSVAIAGAAMVLTYAGTAEFCHQHGAPGWRGYTIAAMNDAAVLVGIAWPARPLQALAGLCAGLTVWANLAHAGPGWEGGLVALTPPFLAILMIGALELVWRSQVSARPVLSAEVSAEMDTGEDTRDTIEVDTDRTPQVDTTGHEVDTRPDTGADTEADTEGDTGPDTTPDTRPDTRRRTVVPITASSDRDRVIDRVEAGELTHKAAAEELGCSTKTISRALAARTRTERTG